MHVKILINHIFRARDENDISNLRIASSPALTPQHPTSPSNPNITPGNPGIAYGNPPYPGCGLKNGIFSQVAAQQFSNRPKTSSSHLNLKPASFQTLQVDFHRPITSHMTGRAFLKGYFLPRKSDSSLSRQKVSETLE